MSDHTSKTISVCVKPFRLNPAVVVVAAAGRGDRGLSADGPLFAERQRTAAFIGGEHRGPHHGLFLPAD